MRKIHLLSSLAFAATFVSIPVFADENAAANASNPSAKSAEIQAGGMSDAAYDKLFPVIKQKELAKDLRKKSVTVVDVNGTESYASGHIPGAIDFTAAGDRFPDMLPKDKSALVVAYCGGPGCQAWRQAASKLHALGYTNVRHYKGGIQEWKASGKPMEKA